MVVQFPSPGENLIVKKKIPGEQIGLLHPSEAEEPQAPVQKYGHHIAQSFH